MGVHGLRGFLQSLEVEGYNDLDSNDAASAALRSGAATLAVDGDGLIFHLFRLAYRPHRRNVLSSLPPTNDADDVQGKALQTQLLLPSLTPPSLAHDVVTSYLSQLTTKHGLHLRIYFDGPDQYMKQLERQLRRERREDEWENVRRLCDGNLPEGDGPSKLRSSAKKQAREHKRRSSLPIGADAEAEDYLGWFPVSPLVMNQIERSIEAFADMSPILPSGSVQVIQCDGEADVEVARASANDALGMTYALANDSDYLIYGSGGEGAGETKYIQFHQLDPSTDALLSGSVLTRSGVAADIGLPSPEAMIELSIIMGNDYTGPFLKGEDLKRSDEYRDSVQWYREGEQYETEKLPSRRFDPRGVADHVAEKVAEGWKLTSTNPDLHMAIEFSYKLYSFGDVSGFPPAAPGSMAEGDKAHNSMRVFPTLPRGLDLSLATGSSSAMNVCDAALLPILTYGPEVGVEQGGNNLEYLEPRHLDAFRAMMERMRYSEGVRMSGIKPPRRVMRWGDVQSLYVLEKCLLAAVEDRGDPLQNMPCKLFDQSLFRSCLERLSLEEDLQRNEAVTKNERTSFEEAANEIPEATKEEEPKKLVLPIDEHREDILRTVATQRVTIIHGETGCGKSSRVPCFLLRADPPEPTRKAPAVKMIVSQPRRIAAKALAERVRGCEPDLKDKIGLRMGHGIREHETSKTRAWFVTTGYVVRLLANYPGWFDSHTHLIIDEVHERSVDTDILCLLCRRLLHSHPTIRLVLMSATMAAELYSQYFGSPQPPIHVGARRFPIREYFVEDLQSLLKLPPKTAKLASDVHESCENSRCGTAPSPHMMEKLYQLAAAITSSVGGHGSAVLIFVPGMSDIEAIIELIEKLRVPGAAFICLPIHSDVPFEEQMAAFEPPNEGEVKVIIATNAAESSLTLPDVDHVICLGLCKQIVYNKASHRQMLVPTWISRASATQRAGRTGRVREGNVYRLYSRNAFDEYMPPYEEGEMVRIPLDSVILSLRDMLNEAVTPVLLDCLEPPDVSTIERSFQSLHASNFISDPTDEGDITSLGSLVVALGVDLTLGALVGLGIQFGVAAEATMMAAILSFPKAPWAITSPLYHDAETFNQIVTKTFVSRCSLDSGLFSEPMAIAGLLHEYSNIAGNRDQFCWKHRVSASRMRHLRGTVESLKRRVAEYLGVSAELLEIEEPPSRMCSAKLNILRILQVWLFSDTMIVQSASKRKVECASGGSLSVDLDGPPIGKRHLNQILHAERHPFEIKSSGKIVQSGSFDSENLLESRGDYFDSFETRFASYVLEVEFDLSFYFVGTSIKILVPAEIWELPESSKLRDSIIGKNSMSIKEVSYLGRAAGGNQCGVRGRACGAWHPQSVDSELALTDYNALPSKCVIILSGQLTKSQAKEFRRRVDKDVASRFESINSILSCSISQSTKNKVTFSMSSSGECNEISQQTLCDMFAAPDLEINQNMSTLRQSIKFPRAKIISNEDGFSHRPLVEDAPEGARLMSVLASERRRDNFIRFSNGSDGDDLDVNLPKKFSINSGRWKRKDGGGMVFVPENCVPVAVIPTDKNLELFACCANTLDLRGGACRVEGISMLPPGRMFVGLALLCFGINPKTGLPVDSVDVFDIQEYNVEEKKEAGEIYVVREALRWIHENDKRPPNEWVQSRILDALEFHAACMELGETLKCQPDKIKCLCEIFDEVSGQGMAVWDGYDNDLVAATASLRPKHIRRRSNRQTESSTSKVCNTDEENEQRPFSSRDNNDRSIPTRPTDKKSKRSKYIYACPGCKSTFIKWTPCRNHMTECCPDKQLNMREAAALGSSVGPDYSPPTQVVDSKPKKANLPKQSTTVWVCSGCEGRFEKKKMCEKHIKKCSFGLVKDTSPKMMHVYT